MVRLAKAEYGKAYGLNQHRNIYLEKVKITPNYDESSVSFKYFGCDDVEVSIYDGDSLIAKTKDTTVSIPDFKSWSPEFTFFI